MYMQISRAISNSSRTVVSLVWNYFAILSVVTIFGTWALLKSRRVTFDAGGGKPQPVVLNPIMKPNFHAGFSGGFSKPLALTHSLAFPRWFFTPGKTKLKIEPVSLNVLIPWGILLLSFLHDGAHILMKSLNIDSTHMTLSKIIFILHVCIYSYTVQNMCRLNKLYNKIVFVFYLIKVLYWF